MTHQLPNPMRLQRTTGVMLLLLGLLFASEPQAFAGPPRPTLRAKSCSPLTPMKVSHNGLRVSFRAGNKSWILSLRERRVDLDPKQSMPESSRSVLLSSDGRLQIKAETDNTLRWVGTSRREVRLSFCFWAENQAWITFTPSGYYLSVGSDVAASTVQSYDPKGTSANRASAVAGPAADSLVGWEVAQASGRADYFPLGLFAKQLQRDEIVKRVLSSPQLDEEEVALAVSNERNEEYIAPNIIQLLPPVLTILSPENDASITTTSITVKVGFRRYNDRPYVIRVSSAVDSKSVPIGTESAEASRPIQPDAQLAKGSDPSRVTLPYVETTIKVPPTDSNIEVSAHSVDLRTESRSTAISLRWQGGKVIEEKPDVYLVAIGVNRYTDHRSFPALAHAEKDAADFVSSLRGMQGTSYRKVFTPNQSGDPSSPKGTKQQILAQLEWLKGQPLRDNDLAVLFLSGHGVRSGESGQYYFPPSDADRSDPQGTMIDAYTLQSYLSLRRAGRMLVFLDTCHSGGAAGDPSVMKALAQDLSRLGNVVVFTSSTDKQASLEWKKWGNGAFTKAVLESLRGEADPEGTGHLTVSLMDYYVNRRVRELTFDRQTPTSAKPAAVTDFEIARVWVRPWRKKSVRFAVLGTLAAALAAGAVSFGLLYHPDYKRGNTNWLVQF